MSCKNLKIAVFPALFLFAVMGTRQVSAQNIYINNVGQLLVSGTDANDDITIEIEDFATGTRSNPQYRAFVVATVKNLDTGESLWKLFPLEDVSEIFAYGWGGDDDMSNITPINSRMYGGHGSDLVSGGSGIDFLHGGPGADHIYGYGGDDILHAGNDPWGTPNILTGDGGFDTYVYNAQDMVTGVPGWQLKPDEHYTAGPDAGMSMISE